LLALGVLDCPEDINEISELPELLGCPRVVHALTVARLSVHGPGLPAAVAVNALRAEWPGMGQPVGHVRQNGGVDVTNLIFVIVGTAAGVGALMWGVITWRRSGPVVTVDVNQGFPAYDDHVGEPITCVTATNSGRAPVTVTSWGLRLPDGQTMFVQQPF